MKTLRLQITGDVPLGGHKPGEIFQVKVKSDGKTPVSIYWRKRLADESKYKSGAVSIYKQPKKEVTSKSKDSDK